jgi:hypothetical protein
MSDTQYIFTITKALLMQCVNSTAYPSKTIIQGYQPPTTGNFIIMLRPHFEKTSITPVDTYSYVTTGDVYTKNSQLLYRNLMQIDFYSDDTTANVYTAPDNASIFHNYLCSNAQEYLGNNYFGNEIGVIEEVKNLTEILDKPGYAIRYSQRFELFTHNYYDVSADYFTQINIANRLTDTNPSVAEYPEVQE